MKSFNERLKKYPESAYRAKPSLATYDLTGLLYVALGAKVGAPKVIACHQQPGGVMSAMFAVDLLMGVEASRLLSALGDLLRDLANSTSDEEIAALFGELMTAEAVIAAHVEGTRLMLEAARAEMKR